MEILLPARTRAPTTLIERRHAPAVLGFERFRPCLRWEFGFTCSFCLVHEADLTEHGIERSGLTWIEHHVPRAARPDLADSYPNCFYSCRFCNQARHARPNTDSLGRRILEPCSSSWGEHFDHDGDRLMPLTGDGEYTYEAYDLDDPRKRMMRAERADLIANALRVLTEVPGREAALLALAETADEDVRYQLVEAAHELRDSLRRALADLSRFRAIPKDADASCQCPHEGRCVLPPHVADACICLT